LAVVVGVSCAHRAEAFHACHALIDELKATVPVWKHQRFTDGTDEWVGSALFSARELTMRGFSSQASKDLVSKLVRGWRIPF